MSDLGLNVGIPNKASWPIKTVNSLFSLISRGTAPVYVEHSEVLAIGQRCVASTGFASDFARPHAHRAVRNVLRPEFGDVLLNSTGTGTIGRSVVFDSPGTFIVDGHVTVMRPRAEVADSRWLTSLLRTPWLQRHLERFCYAGSTNQLELSRTPLRASRLPVPHIDEQRAIGRLLDTLDTAIHGTEAIVAKLNAIKQGLLHDLLTRGIEANGELRPPQAEAPQLYMQSPLGWIPKGWSVAPFGSKIEVIDPNPSHRYPQEQDIGVPICSTENFDGEDDYLLDRSKRMPNSVFASQNSRCEFSENQVIFARKGRIGLARRYGHEKKVFSHTVVVLVSKNESVDQKWLLWLARSAGFINGIRLRMNSNSGVPTLGIELIKSVVTAFPPSPEQAQIGKILDSTSSRIRQEERKLAGLMNLRRGVMDDLLTGRVRVTPLLADADRQKECA